MPTPGLQERLTISPAERSQPAATQASKKYGRRDFPYEPLAAYHQKLPLMFSALPGGNGNSGSFNNVGNNGNWWSSTENNASNAYNRNINNSNANVNRNNNDKTNLYSVRCAKD